MIHDENGMLRFKKAEKIEAYKCARCDTTMLATHSNDWLDLNHPDGEKIKMCNSCYGLIAVIEKK
ncbi:hypothetical protein [Desulfosporosinus sp. Sb-LF]|uniref:hypothetical protein n=1 Tax=Desulfosporosinus sp. Sb-LF TaxID=2560027 RepID=UPI00107F2A18|nr:hypothetical protein [Desulfosporosinus sp. Sb-LF]